MRKVRSFYRHGVSSVQKNRLNHGDGAMPDGGMTNKRMDMEEVGICVSRRLALTCGPIQESSDLTNGW